MIVNFDDIEIMAPDYGGGTVFYPNTTQFSSECEFMDGIPNGRQVEYWTNGLKKVEYFKRYGGLFYGSFKEWDEHAVLILHQEYDENGNFIKKYI